MKPPPPPANDNVPRSGPRELFGRRRVVVELSAPVASLTARLVEDGGEVVGIRCGELMLMSPHPVYALCRQLKLSGWPDSSMQVRHRDRSAAVFVLSIYAVADFSLENLRQQWNVV